MKSKQETVPLQIISTQTHHAFSEDEVNFRSYSTDDVVQSADARPNPIKRYHSDPLQLLTIGNKELKWQDKILFQRLILRLAKALFIYGAPSYRVERRVQSISEAFGIPLEIVCQPSYILISFGEYGLASPTINTSEYATNVVQNTFFLKVRHDNQSSIPIST